MQISFSGVIAPYTYNCPYAHKLRNIDKVKIPKKEQDLSAEPFKCQRGIDLHDAVAEYITGMTDTFQYTTSTVNAAKEQHTYVEYPFYSTQEFSPLDRIPEDDSTFIYMRCDAVYTDGCQGIIYDWKFTTLEFGAAHHYDELEFFLAGHSARFNDIGLWKIVIHSPEFDYTLPIRTYEWPQISRLQQRYISRINTILNDRLFIPNPSKARCKFCNYRSEDTGGSSLCDYTVV
jgi:hypothetical protein